MPKVIRMPQNLGGARRRFIEEVFSHYRAAGRPTLDAISGRIKARDDLAGTASRETIRRVLSEGTVPQTWTTIEAILTVLCELAGYKPTSLQWVDRPGSSQLVKVTHKDHMRRLWNEAVDEPPPLPDPWDEPPF